MYLHAVWRGSVLENRSADYFKCLCWGLRVNSELWEASPRPILMERLHLKPILGRLPAHVLAMSNSVPFAGPVALLMKCGWLRRWQRQDAQPQPQPPQPQPPQPPLPPLPQPQQPPLPQQQLQLPPAAPAVPAKVAPARPVLPVHPALPVLPVHPALPVLPVHPALPVLPVHPPLPVLPVQQAREVQARLLAMMLGDGFK